MNKIVLQGTINGDCVLSHESHGEAFHRFSMSVKRKSDAIDILPCIISEVLLPKICDKDKVKIIGEIRTRNVHDDEGNTHLSVFVFVFDVEDYDGSDINHVSLNGFVCKDPKYRSTPLGRNITDVLIASNRERSYNSDYIPCISWGRNALKTSLFEVGDNVKAIGRLQSRQYNKKREDGAEELRTAYELSICEICTIGGDDDE